MKDAEIREKLSEGWLHAIVMFEVAGKPKEHVEKSLSEFMDNIRKDERVIILSEDREPAEEHEDGMFSAFSECEMIVNQLETFTWLCVNFSPASVEILDPEEFRLEARDVTNWLNDLLAKLHSIAMDYRTQKSTSKHLTVAMNQLIRNAIVLSLKTGEKTEEEISEDTGISGVQLEPFLSKLIEQSQIVQAGKTYRLA